MELAVACTPDCHVGLAISIEIARQRNVTGYAPLNEDVWETHRGMHKPAAQGLVASQLPKGWSPDRHIGLAISIEIARQRNVTDLAPYKEDVFETTRGMHKPAGLGLKVNAWSPDRHIGLPISIEIARHRNVTRYAPLYGRNRVAEIACRGKYMPHAVACTPDRHVGLAIPIEIARFSSSRDRCACRSTP